MLQNPEKASPYIVHKKVEKKMQETRYNEITKNKNYSCEFPSMINLEILYGTGKFFINILVSYITAEPAEWIQSVRLQIQYFATRFWEQF